MKLDHGDKQILIGLRTCAEEGDEDSARMLRESFETALKDAQTGDAESQYALAMHYDYGFGTEENKELSFQWFEKAAMQGHIGAMRCVAWAYWHGYGVELDRQKGDEWDKKRSYALREEIKRNEGIDNLSGASTDDETHEQQRARRYDEEAKGIVSHISPEKEKAFQDLYDRLMKKENAQKSAENDLDEAQYEHEEGKYDGEV